MKTNLKTSLHLFIITTLFISACDHHDHGHGDHNHSGEGISEVAEEVCIHLDNGPEVALTATPTSDENADPVTLDQSHVRYDISLSESESGEGYEGVVTLSVDQASEVLIGARVAMGDLGDLVIEVSSAESGESVSAESLDDHREEIAESCLLEVDRTHSAIYPLSLGQYDFTIRHSQPTIQLVLEALEAKTDDEHDH